MLVGKAEGVDPFSFAAGPETRTRKYASQELFANWEDHSSIVRAASSDWLSIQRGWWAPPTHWTPPKLTVDCSKSTTRAWVPPTQP